MLGRIARLICVLTVTGAAVLAARAQELGTIAFPTSGEPAAQPKFLEGVKALHSFQFDEAALAFREAQKLDPGFALAYWGEAMSYNHPLWAEQNLTAARRALETLAPTPEQRLAKAKLPKEQALLAAADELFYGPDDKLTRDQAYSDAMARLYERWPDDDEVATFYALSLLGTVRPGDTGFRRQARAAAIAQQVFEKNPNHPGAAHFIIHAFDDPDHAPLGLPAARVYARIAPAAAHALHMPSHIFVQLGMWDDVVRSNVDAYRAAVEINTRLNLPEGREDFHTLSWLAYGNTMLGRYDDARANVELARAAAERNPDSAGVRDGWLAMRARYLLDTGQWEAIARDGTDVAPHAEQHAMPGMPLEQAGAGAWRVYAGMSAAYRGDAALAEAIAADLAELREQVARTSEYNARGVAIQEKEVAALAKRARGDLDAALTLAKEAADIELSTSPPSGPPAIMKPAHELYGELLLEADRAQEAVAAFQRSLLRTPLRTPALLGLARAAAAARDQELARQTYTTLRDMPAAAPAAPAVYEAAQWLAANAR